jgi:hypothetical protein
MKYLILTYRSTPASSRPGSISSSTSICEGTALGPEDVGAKDGVSAKVTLLCAPADEDGPVVFMVSILVLAGAVGEAVAVIFQGVGVAILAATVPLLT